jgi:putative ABC transport system ATP-binding protein
LEVLVVENLHKVYEGPLGGVAALKGLSFTAARGDFLAIRGPSGCGKSTLLHIVGGMDRPSQGQVWLGERLLNDFSPAALARLRRRQVGFVFQSFNLLPTLTVLENVMLPLLLDHAANRAARQRAETLLAQVGLGDRAGHLPAQLSGGEMQRAAVARAVVAEPQLLLADEPTGNLDSVNGQRVMELLVELNRGLGVTVLLATHAPEAAGYARRTLHLRDGFLERTEDHAPLCDALPTVHPPRPVA